MPHDAAVKEFERAGEQFYNILLDDVRAEIGPLIAEINVLRARVAALESKNKRLQEALKE